MKIVVTGGSGFIGTNLTQLLHDKGIEFLNIDNVQPKDENLKKFWVNVSIMDYSGLLEQFRAFQPDAVVHLAAETRTHPHMKMEDYTLNTVGTANVIDAIRATESVKRFVHTSTQFVHQGETPPQHDEDFAPHTIYGESKIINEKQVRNADLKCTWTIIRPTNIWGPWHLRYPFEFWRVLARGRYVHPGRKRVLRSYGYVGNVVYQIYRILTQPEKLVDRKVYYVGDRAIDLYEWVNGFSIQQCGRNVRVVPSGLVYTLALFGDMLAAIKINFPITRSRYRSMTTDNAADMEKTFRELGESPFTLDDGIRETVKWLRKEHPDLVKVKPK